MITAQSKMPLGENWGAGGWGKGIKKSYQYLENIHQATDILTSSDSTARSGTQTSLSTGWVKLSTKGSPHEPYDTKQKVLLQGNPSSKRMVWGQQKGHREASLARVRGLGGA